MATEKRSLPWAPRLSVITACYNAEKTIGRTLRAVLCQGGEFQLEHVIQDGGSSDGTFALVKDYAAEAKHAVSYASGRDHGFYDGINKALERATGQIIGLINADDWLADGHVLQNVVQVFRDSPTVQAIYADLDYVRLSGEPTQVAAYSSELRKQSNGPDPTVSASKKFHGDSGQLPYTQQHRLTQYNRLRLGALSFEFPMHQVVRHWIAGQYSISSFRNGWMPPHPTVYVRREVYQRLGGYRLDMASAADYEWMVRVFVKHRIEAAYLPRVTVKMLVGGQSNASLIGRLVANRKDRAAWTVNHLRPFPWFSLVKPLRKLPQFFRR